MTNNDALVELAKHCTKTCHMLKDVAHGRGADSLRGSSQKAIEDFGRYADPAHHSLSTITNDIRTMRNIDSVVSERRNGPNDSRERHFRSSDEYLIRQKTELREILRILGVRENYLRGM